MKIEAGSRTLAIGEAALLKERHPDFAAFYASAFDTVLAATRGFTGDADIAYEATQEAFARALTRWERIGREKWVIGWVVRTAANHSRRLGARSKREVSHRVEISGEPDWADRIDIVAALRRMPTRRRLALVLFYIADLTVAEAAQVMELSEGAVRAHLTIGRRELRESLEDKHA